MPDIQPLGPDQAEAATGTLARAFHTDPMIEWIFPDPAERATAVGHLFRVPVRTIIKRGHATATDEVRAVAAWMPPGRTMTLGAMLLSGMLATPFQIGFRTFGKFAGAMDAMEKIHKRRMAEPHWYLAALGVDPELQGQGRGSALVQEGADRADQEGVPCYLETSRERNLPFYERHGFEVVETARLGKDGPPAWAMIRAAR